MEVLNHSPATWHGERLGLGMAWAVLTSPWRSCLPGLCSCDRECSRISTCMGPSGPYIHHQEPSIFLSLSHSSFSEPSGRSASTDYIHLSLLVNPGLCCFLNQSGIDTDSGWGPGHPFWRAVGVTGLWLKWIYDLHPIYCSRYKDHPQDHCPEPHGNPATLDAIGYHVSGLSSESTTMMVPSSVHPSFCDLKSWVDWEGPVRPHGMYFSWRSPLPSAQHIRLPVPGLLGLSAR